MTDGVMEFPASYTGNGDTIEVAPIFVWLLLGWLAWEGVGAFAWSRTTHSLEHQNFGDADFWLGVSSFFGRPVEGSDYGRGR